MKKVTFSDIYSGGLKKICENKQSTIYKTKSGEAFKRFNSKYLKFLNMKGIDVENKLLDATPVFYVPEIVTPTSVVYDRGNFVGYTTCAVNGVDLEKYLSDLCDGQRRDLNGYASLYSEIESPVKRANNIVFPDLCTVNNIMITNQGTVKLVDYDGLQVGNKRSASFSTLLGEQEQYHNSKYIKNGLYTKELDKKSLIALYFMLTFNVDIGYIGKISENTGKVITVDDVFEQIGLEDDIIKHKVWKCFQNNEENEYLGDDVYRVAEKYDMDLYRHPKKAKTYVKILTEKN